MTPRFPFIFDEFFASGKEESISPFLTPSSRPWGKNLPLRTALLSSTLLIAAFCASYTQPALFHLLLLSVYFLSGTPALIGALEDLKNLEINIDVLMTSAALLSVLIGSGLEGALLLVLFELSASMENAVSQKTKSTLLSLHKLAPKTAWLLSDKGILLEKAIQEIRIQDRLLVKAGELIPLDGTVVEGSSSINLVHLTGESLPIPKKIGETVPAGAYNLDGSLTITVTRTSGDSTLSRIIQLITQASEAKPKLERFLTRFGRPYATTIICLSLLFALTLPLLFALPYTGPEGAIYRALTFLIAASPCALIIATPTAYLSAINSCARRGILLKGGTTLDAIASCTQVAFDKTGTLTTGKLHCTQIKSIGELAPWSSVDLALSVAAGLERQSTHPIAEAITTLALNKKCPPREIHAFKSIPGFGLQGEISLSEKQLPVYIGHEAFILDKLPEHARQNLQRQPGHTLTTFLLIADQLFTLHFTDTLRTEAPPLIQRLKEQNRLHPIMLTGDHPDIAQEIGAQVGISTIYAHLRPEDKLSKVAELSKTGGLMMVGDGINDAPALARASVGICMGKIGSATAVEAADVVFLNDDLSLLDWLYKKAHKTVQIVRQNLFLALGVILFATTPALLGIVPLWAAVLLHEGGTLLVGLNSLRLLRR